MISEDLLHSMQIRLLTADYHTPTDWWNFKKVNSPYSRLYMITDGAAQVTHQKQTYQLTPGDVMLIPCFSNCDLFCPDHFSHYHINFTTRLKGGVDLFSAFQCQWKRRAHKGEMEIFQRLMDLNPTSRLDELNPYRQLRSLDKKAIHQEPSELFESIGLMYLLLTPFMETLEESQNTGLVNRRLREVFTYIHDNIHRHIRLEELAELVSLNAVYFSNLFSELTGMRPTEYMTKHRVERAYVMLLTTGYNISEIADMLGFANTAHFSRTFKKYQGLSPRQYRELHQRV